MPASAAAVTVAGGLALRPRPRAEPFEKASCLRACCSIIRRASGSQLLVASESHRRVMRRGSCFHCPLREMISCKPVLLLGDLASGRPGKRRLWLHRRVSALSTKLSSVRVRRLGHDARVKWIGHGGVGGGEFGRGGVAERRGATRGVVGEVCCQARSRCSCC